MRRPLAQAWWDIRATTGRGGSGPGTPIIVLAPRLVATEDIHLPSGEYIYRLQAGEYVESRKMLYLK
jgi:hypothetical protein